MVLAAAWFDASSRPIYRRHCFSASVLTRGVWGSVFLAGRGAGPARSGRYADTRGAVTCIRRGAALRYLQACPFCSCIYAVGSVCPPDVHSALCPVLGADVAPDSDVAIESAPEVDAAVESSAAQDEAAEAAPQSEQSEKMQPEEAQQAAAITVVDYKPAMPGVCQVCKGTSKVSRSGAFPTFRVSKMPAHTRINESIWNTPQQWTPIKGHRRSGFCLLVFCPPSPILGSIQPNPTTKSGGAARRRLD